VLHGITRMTALDLCAELGVPAESGTLDAGLLRSADEVFLTSTAGGIAPITRIDGQPVAGGQPGPITRRLTELYWEKHSDPAWTTAIESLG